MASKWLKKFSVGLRSARLQPRLSPHPSETTRELDPKVIDTYLGTYSAGLFGEVKVARRGEALFASSASGDESELVFESETKFFTDNPQITGRFLRDGQGRVAEVIIKLFEQDIHAKKKKP